MVLMMGLSGALAGLGGASEVGDFRHVLIRAACSRQGSATRGSWCCARRYNHSLFVSSRFSWAAWPTRVTACKVPTFRRAWSVCCKA